MTTQTETTPVAHTPGPWNWAHVQDLRPNGSIFEITNERGAVICRTVDDSSSDRVNSNLIYAAPDLLEAAQNMLKRLEVFPEGSTGMILEENRIKLKAAVAKATSEATP